MQELIQQIAARAGISEQQALVAANTTKDFIKTKVPPPVAAMVDQFFAGTFDPTAAMKTAADQQSDFMSKAKDTAQQATEKITDFTQQASGKIAEYTHEAIDKSQEFAKEAASHINEWAKQAGGWSEEALSKFKNIFGAHTNSGDNTGKKA